MQAVFEKIIEKLEEMIHPKQLYFCKYARGGCKHLDNDDKDCMECVVENAIEIVKQGGVADDVCEYENTNDEYCKWKINSVFHETINNPHVAERENIATTKYCPYCGKKIKVVE